MPSSPASDPAAAVYRDQVAMQDLTPHPCTLIETAKLNGVDPQAWLTDILGRIADHKITRIAELLAWRYAAAAA